MKKTAFSFKISILLAIILVCGILQINYGVTTLLAKNHGSKTTDKMTLIGIDYLQVQQTK